MSTYVPELGQAAFGQPYGPCECPEFLEAALGLIRVRLEYLVEAALPFGDQWASPFSNSGNSFSCPVFEVAAYSWNEDVEQEWNFRCGDIKVSWYKWFGRGMTCPTVYGPDQISSMLERCLAWIDKASEMIEEEYGKPLSEEAQSVREALSKDKGWAIAVPDVPTLRVELSQMPAGEHRERDAIEAENAGLKAELERLRVENERFHALFGENGKGYLTVRDLCFTAFMRAHDRNAEDGGPTDWFNDTLPTVMKGIDRMAAYVSGK